MEIVHPAENGNRGTRSLRRSLALPVMVAIVLCAIFLFYRSGEQTAPLEGEVRNIPIRTTTARVAGVDPDSLTVSDPNAVRAVSKEDALAINGAIPFVKGSNPAATSLILPFGMPASWTHSVDCLTAAIYYEAANEPLEGQQAVAQVVLNRVRHPVYPHTVCAVVFQGAERATGCQFSFTCDGSLSKAPVAALWDRARKVAIAAIAGHVYGPVGWATHYHADYVAPYWAPTLAKVAMIGHHIFYRWPGGTGQPVAFTARYAGNEPDLWTAALGGAFDRDYAQKPGTPEGDVPSTDRPILARSGVALSAVDGNPAVRLLADMRAPEKVQSKDVPAGGRWILGGTRDAGGPAPATQAVPVRTSILPAQPAAP